MAGLLLGAGTLGAQLGHRQTFLAGLVIFGGASLLAAFAPDSEWLIGARALLGFGAAAMMPATLALIRVTFGDQRERNLAIALWGSLAIVGAALGPIVGGMLLEWFWWGSVFLVNVPIALVTLTASNSWRLPVSAPRRSPSRSSSGAELSRPPWSLPTARPHAQRWPASN